MPALDDYGVALTRSRIAQNLVHYLGTACHSMLLQTTKIFNRGNPLPTTNLGTTSPGKRAKLASSNRDIRREMMPLSIRPKAAAAT